MRTVSISKFLQDHRKLVLVAILVLASAWRLVYFLEMRQTPYGNDLMMDSAYHDELAREIAAGRWIGEEPFFRAPLYPYLLGVVYSLSGNSVSAMKVFQMLLGCISCLLTYLLARELFPREVAVIAFLMCGLYGTFIYFENELLIPALIVFLDLGALLILIRALKSRKWRQFYFSGLLFGLSAIARPNILLFVLFIPGIVWWSWRKRRETKELLKPLLFGALGVALPIIPALVYNVAAGGDFVPIASQGGVNFYIGNNADSDGHTAVVPGTRANWWGGHEDQINLAKRALGDNQANPSQISGYWFRRGLEFLVENPGAAARLYLNKLSMFWNGYEIGNNRNIHFVARHSILFKYLTLKFWIICPLAFVGIFLAIRNRVRVAPLLVFIVAYMVSVVLFFVNARYRMPIIPLLVILAAYAVHELTRLIARQDGGRDGNAAERRTTFAIIAVILVFSATLVFPRPRGDDLAEARFHESLAFQRAGDFENERRSLEKALEADPEMFTALVNLGIVIARETKQYGEAAKCFRRAVELAPRETEALYNLAMILVALDDLPGAKEYLLRYLAAVAAQDLRRENLNQVVTARCKLAAIYEKETDIARAVAEYERALELSPDDYRVLAYYGRANINLGRYDEAEKAIDRALSLKPDDEFARQIWEYLLAKRSATR